MNTAEQSKKKILPSRYPLVDFLRGVAVILMIIFHIAYDLNFFHFVEISFTKNMFWYIFPRVIVFLFMICVGMGLCLTHQNVIKWPKVWKRFRQLGLLALIITVVTWFIFKESFVFFGTLHCIALCSLAGVFFVNRPKLSLGLGLVTVITNLIMQKNFVPWSKIFGASSVDYIPFYPWFGVVLLGIYAYHRGMHLIQWPRAAWSKPINFLGQHSLIIYLTHQVILFLLVWAAYKFLR